MANLESGSELPNLKIEIENDLEDAMETDDNENKMEYKTIKDDDPEEGELSDSKDVVKDAKVSTYGLNASTNDVTWDREKRYENKGGAFVTGVDIFAKEVQSKLHERAKRFGLDPSDVKAITDHQITELYKSLGVKEKEEEGAEKHFRLNALHMRGTEDLSTQDIFNYFKDYGPASIEWINDFSCNVVWLDNISAARAMIGLSKHIKGLEEFHSKADPFLKQEEKEKGSDKENEKEEIVIVQEIEEPDGDDIIMVMERSSTFIPPTKPTDEKVDEEMSVDSDEVQASEITIPIPPGKWRMGVPHPKAKCILLRFSTRTDKKQPQAEKMSEYYKKYGNPNYGGIKGIITQSRKRRYQRQDHNSKVFEDDQGDERDFSEPPADGKNPWGNLAKTWSKLDKTRSRRKSEVKTVEESSNPAKPVPEKQLHSDEQRVTSVLHRIGPIASPAAVKYESDNSHTSDESDKEPDWTRRSKIPRMRMYADEEEIRLERRKAQVQAQTRKCSRNYREKEFDEESRETSRRKRSHRESSRSRRYSSDNRKSKVHKDFDRGEDDLRSRLARESKPKLKGSIVEASKTVWNRINQKPSDDDEDDDVDDESDSEKQCTASESGSETDRPVVENNLNNFADLRGSLLQSRKKNSQFNDGDLRSKLNFKKTMRQQVPAQKSPLRIEIDNDEYYRLIGSDQE